MREPDWDRAKLIIQRYANGLQAACLSKRNIYRQRVTPGDRAQALQIMDNISNKLTIVIANIKGTQNSLTQANSIVSNEVMQLDNAGR